MTDDAVSFAADDAWRAYLRQRQEMLARHEAERREMFYRQRAESELMTQAYLDARGVLVGQARAKGAAGRLS